MNEVAERLVMHMAGGAEKPPGTVVVGCLESWLDAAWQEGLLRGASAGPGGPGSSPVTLTIITVTI